MRDAAAYALWSLARAQDPSSLKPHVTGLAQILAAVSLYDREIHIRRAASAAFQEHVGRMVHDFFLGQRVLANRDGDEGSVPSWN